MIDLSVLVARPPTQTYPHQMRGRGILAALACAALTLACGGPDVAFTGAGSAGETGSGGGQGGETSSVVSGSGGGDEGGTGGAGGSSSSAGGDGGAAEGGGGSAGAGGMEPEPLCPAPSCVGPNDADTVINCDPACGPLHQACSTICDEPANLQPAAIGYGVTKIQLPPITEQDPFCDLHCGSQGPLMAMRLQAPVDLCVTMDGPAGAAMYVGGLADQPVSMCPWGGAPLGCDDVPAMSVGGGTWITFAVLSGQPLPDGGSVVSLTVAQDGCQPAACDGGCNGVGGEVQPGNM